MNAEYSEAMEKQVALYRAILSPSWQDMREVMDEPIRERGLGRSASWPLLQSLLGTAEPYYWSGDTARLVTTTCDALPDSTRLSRDLLPSEAGFYLFEAAQPRFWLATEHDVVGMLWGIDRLVEDHVLVKHDATRPCIWLVPLFRILRYPYLFPAPPRPWFLADSVEEFVSQWPEWKPEFVQLASHTAKWLAASMLFMQQSVLTAQPMTAERHVRKRAQREAWPREPIIRVVVLRRHEHVSSNQRSGAIGPEWSCQWLVRGHWRQQPCGPKHGQRHPRWITPYVKGPENKPLKPPRATVFAVVR